MSDNLSYNKAIAELEEILKKIQSDNSDIDSMVGLTKRAAELIEKCRARLTATESELKAVLDSLRPAD